jgi:hypothetical protein
MKPIKSLILLATLAYSLGTVNAQSNLSFNKIRLSGGATVELKQGNSNSISFADSSRQGIEKVYTTTSNGWINISGKPGDEILVSATLISQIDISGVGKIESDELFKTNNLELNVSGTGKIELNVEAEKINCAISGSGKIELNGTADALDVQISGSGKVDAENLKAKTVIVNISGSGKALVNPIEVLNSNISGSGSVYYVSEPPAITETISGSGKVKDADVIVTDTTRITLGKKKLLFVDDEGKSVRLEFKDAVESYKSKLKSHWAGFELGINMLVDDQLNTKPLPGYEFLDQRWEKSIAVNFNLYDYEINLYRKNIMLVTGIGFTINNYRFTSQSYLVAGADSVIAYTDPSVDVQKNKLVANYLTVPLLIEFNTSQNPKKTAHIAFGIIGGVKIASHGKIITEKNGNEVKTKFYDQYNLNPWRYDATVRLGYRGFTVFGSYDMASVFKKNKGPEVSPMTVGLRLVGW